MYARNDRFGKPVALSEIAEATAEYLAKVQWGCPEGSEHTPAAVKSHLEDRKPKYAHLVFNEADIDMEELTEVLANMKPGKAPGPDLITMDALKDLTDNNKTALLHTLNEMWYSEHLPDGLAQARVVSLYKKGNPRKQENYRPISLLNAFYKVLAAVLKRRLEATLEPLLMATQFGFRKKRSTTQPLFAARRLQDFAE